MKHVIVNFTDSYGIQHDAAVVEVAYGCKSFTDYETIGDNPSKNTQISAQIQYRFWHSAEAKAGGAQPIPFVTKSGQNTFGTLPLANDIVDFEAYCLIHFTDVLLKEDGGTVIPESSNTGV